MAKDRVQQEAEGSAFRAGPPRERTPLRDNLESIVIAVVLVLCVRQLVVEAFRIRHGSMAPTLVGDHKELRCPNCGWTFNVGLDKAAADPTVKCPNCRYEWEGASAHQIAGKPMRLKWPAWLWNSAQLSGGQAVGGSQVANRVPRGAARIFVNKFLYRFRKPQRWDVAVFIYPEYDARCRLCGWQGKVQKLKGVKCPECGEEELEIEAKNYIKRVAGLPGETLRIRDGDVYVDGTIARKSARAQSGLWMHVYDSRFEPQREVVPTWDFGMHPDRWSRRARGGLDVDAGAAGGPVMAAFAREVVDFYPYDGTDFRAHNPVGDVRVRARVRVLPDSSDDTEVLLAIADAGHRFRLRLRGGAQPRVALEDGGIAVAEARPRGLDLADWHDVGLQNYDDRLVVTLDGERLLTQDYNGDPGGEHGIRFGALGGAVAWDRIVIERDVYYLSFPGRVAGPQYSLGADEYFMLGDNSPASSDSRRWAHPGIPEENIIGKASLVFWPIHHVGRLSSPR